MAHEVANATHDFIGLLEDMLERIQDLEDKVDGGIGHSLEDRIEILEHGVDEGDIEALRAELRELEERIDALEE